MRALSAALLGLLFTVAYAESQFSSPSVVELRGERAKFIECARGYAIDHVDRFTEANEAFMMNMELVCDAYLTRFISLYSNLDDVRALTDIERSASVHLAIAGVVTDAKTAASSALAIKHPIPGR